VDVPWDPCRTSSVASESSVTLSDPWQYEPEQKSNPWLWPHSDPVIYSDWYIWLLKMLFGMYKNDSIYLNERVVNMSIEGFLNVWHILDLSNAADGYLLPLLNIRLIHDGIWACGLIGCGMRKEAGWINWRSQHFELCQSTPFLLPLSATLIWLGS